MPHWERLRSHLRLRRLDFGPLNALRFLGPGMLVAVGFVDPGNWASNIAAGSGYGYVLLWVVTLSTVMLILLQHNAAHLGIVTGDCLAEATTRHLPRKLARILLGSALLAVSATAFAELLGGAIALNLLFRFPTHFGVLLVAGVVSGVLFLNTYRVVEKLIVGFVSLIGLGFLFEVALVDVNWPLASIAWIIPSIPHGSVLTIMSVLGAVVMPHNLFLHSEFIQSRKWNLQGNEAIKNHLRFELVDTLFSMTVGWAINSAMVLLAAATFFNQGIAVTSLEQAEALLRPILGSAAAAVFGLALLLSGLSSAVTAGMAGGTIVAGMFGRPYDIRERQSKLGILLTLGLALGLALVITNSYQALILSQVALSIQLPFTVLLQLYLTSSRKVMGHYANAGIEKYALWSVAVVVVFLNILLFAQFVAGT